MWGGFSHDVYFCFIQFHACSDGRKQGARFGLYSPVFPGVGLVGIGDDEVAPIAQGVYRAFQAAIGEAYIAEQYDHVCSLLSQVYPHFLGGSAHVRITKHHNLCASKTCCAFERLHPRQDDLVAFQLNFVTGQYVQEVVRRACGVVRDNRGACLIGAQEVCSLGHQRIAECAAAIPVYEKPFGRPAHVGYFFRSRRSERVGHIPLR